MKLAFVVQRYGLEVVGGAEYHCRLIAEHLARHAEVEVLTTCATEHLTWANHYPEGPDRVNDVGVRRFRVDEPRDGVRFARWSAKVLGAASARPTEDDGTETDAEPPPSSLADQERWLLEEGPFSPRLVTYVDRHRTEFDAFVFFSYRYYTTYHGLRAARDRSVLVPTAENDGVHRLALFAPLFRAPRALAYNSPEEREMIEGVAGNGDVPADVIGVGSAFPARMDADAFRLAHGILGPFLLYVGRIDRNKGCRELFTFFRRYREETRSPLRLVLVGEPALPLPRDPNIIPLGFLPDQQKWDALAAALALVMPSRYESLSMVTLEAWWARRPVLANARCEVLRGQCLRSNAGLFYSSYEEFRESLALLEADAGLRQALGESGRRYVDHNYAWEVIERKYLDLLSRARARA